MKRELYYAIRPGSYGPRIIAVTTERGGRWWGRDTRDDLGTHGRCSDLKGRFGTEEAAIAVRDAVQKVHDHFRQQRAVLNQASSRLHHNEEQTIAEVIDGSPKRGAAMVTVTLDWREDRDSIPRPAAREMAHGET